MYRPFSRVLTFRVQGNGFSRARTPAPVCRPLLLLLLLLVALIKSSHSAPWIFYFILLLEVSLLCRHCHCLCHRYKIFHFGDTHAPTHTSTDNFSPLTLSRLLVPVLLLVHLLELYPFSFSGPLKMHFKSLCTPLLRSLDLRDTTQVECDKPDGARPPIARENCPRFPP